MNIKIAPQSGAILIFNGMGQLLGLEKTVQRLLLNKFKLCSEAKRIKTLVLTGVNTRACIGTSAVDGLQHDFEIVVVDETVDSYDYQFHQESKRNPEGRVGTLLNQEF